jgi:hypothetical protein
MVFHYPTYYTIVTVIDGDERQMLLSLMPVVHLQYQKIASSQSNAIQISAGQFTPRKIP